LKLEKYILAMDKTPAVYAAMVLHPAIKTRWMVENWKDHPEKAAWIGQIVNMVKNLYEEEYAGPDRAALAATMAPPAAPTKLISGRFASLNNHKRLKITHEQPAVCALDTLDSWLNENLMDYEDPLEYWTIRHDHYAKSGRPVPALIRMAMDIFAIPSMSAECERVFSSVKLLITDRRRRLGDDIIDISECLRHWYGSAKTDDFDAQSDVEEDSEDEEMEM
jgi:hypothetical protein